MKIQINKMLPYLVITLFTFCITPFLMKDTGSAMFILLVIEPIFVFIISLLYSKKEGFNIVFNIIEGLLFLVTIITVFNPSALIYILFYFIISAIGSFIGNYIKKYNDRIR